MRLKTVLLATLLLPPACSYVPEARTGAGAMDKGRGPDRDHDGVPDDIDRCPDQPGPAATLGCPDRDEDRDGVVDRLDLCPSVAGPPQNNGCPDGTSGTGRASAGTGQAAGATGAAPPSPPAGPDSDLAQLRGGRFVFSEPISFEPARDTLTPRGLAEVEATARVLGAHPELRLLRIEGHVDEPGNTAARARELSERRAQAVKRTLLHFGVAPERLRTQGFGYGRLLDRSETPAAQKINNRIEIVVVE